MEGFFIAPPLSYAVVAIVGFVVAGAFSCIHSKAPMVFLVLWTILGLTAVYSTGNIPQQGTYTEALIGSLGIVTFMLARWRFWPHH